MKKTQDINAYQREWYRKNKEKQRDRAREKYQKNKAYYLEANKKNQEKRKFLFAKLEAENSELADLETKGGLEARIKFLEEENKIQKEIINSLGEDLTEIKRMLKWGTK